MLDLISEQQRTRQEIKRALKTELFAIAYGSH